MAMAALAAVERGAASVEEGAGEAGADVEVEPEVEGWVSVGVEAV